MRRSFCTSILLLAFAAAVSSCSVRAHPAPSLTPMEMLEGVEAELIPNAGSATGYGPDFDEGGYATLIEWNDRLRPEAGWADDYERLDIRLPCCGAVRPFADEERNCGCGHHRALYGAAKHLLDAGYARGATQAALDRWKAYFFPRETLLAELEARSLEDPAYAEAIEALAERGGC